jgi:Adenylate and Guanylate cyclase catalytic domain
VRAHFQVLNEIVAAEAGAVVKTIGDAVMATFPTPDRAVAAALRMREAMYRLNDGRNGHDLLLKIGIHEGRCLAVVLNDRQDYFGTTVNIAARVQGLADSRSILATVSVVRHPQASNLLATSGLMPVAQHARCAASPRSSPFTRSLDPGAGDIPQTDARCRGLTNATVRTRRLELGWAAFDGPQKAAVRDPNPALLARVGPPRLYMQHSPLVRTTGPSRAEHICLDTVLLPGRVEEGCSEERPLLGRPAVRIRLRPPASPPHARQRRKAVPICTALAPKVRAAAIPRVSPIPPVAMIGTDNLSASRRAIFANGPTGSIAATCPTGWTVTSSGAPSNAPPSPTTSSRRALCPAAPTASGGGCTACSSWIGKKRKRDVFVTPETTLTGR